MKNTIATLLVAVSAVAMAANANAETSFRPYVGIDYNYTDLGGHDINYNTGTVNVGTQFNDNFGTEVFYQQSDDDVQTTADGQYTTSFKAYGLDMVGYLPMGCEQEYSLIGTAGVGEYTWNISNNRDASENGRDHGIGYRLGVGGLYNVNDNVALKAMARYVRLNHIEDVNEMVEYTAGVRYNF